MADRKFNRGEKDKYSLSEKDELGKLCVKCKEEYDKKTTPSPRLLIFSKVPTPNPTPPFIKFFKKFLHPHLLPPPFILDLRVLQFWRLIVDLERAKRLLPQVYLPYTNVLPKSWLGIRVNMQQMIRNAGSFSGLVLELKRIINNYRRNKAWLDLIVLLHVWYIITNTFWKIKN